MVLSLVVAFIVEAYFDEVALEHIGKPKPATEILRSPFSLPQFSPAFGEVKWPPNSSTSSLTQNKAHQRRRVPIET